MSQLWSWTSEDPRVGDDNCWVMCHPSRVLAGASIERGRLHKVQCTLSHCHCSTRTNMVCNQTNTSFQLHCSEFSDTDFTGSDYKKLFLAQFHNMWNHESRCLCQEWAKL
jgi:hypothetical protein